MHPGDPRRARPLLLPLLLGVLAPLASSAAQVPAASLHSDSAIVAYLRQRADSFMKRMDVPGAVVTFVRDGRVVMNEGFGLADVASKRPFSADSTVIRIASVAKVFASIAALQQVQAGTLSLTDDISRTVPELELGPSSWSPVTLHNLLTHTAGLDEQYTGYAAAAGEAPAPLGEYVPRHTPARTRPETDVPGYSNHGYGVIGLLVERASGIPFDQYLRDRILQPLGMQRTSFIMRPGTGETPDQATEYLSTGEVRTQRATRPFPAGNIGTTGSDMARLLLELVAATHPDARTSVVTPEMLAQLAGPTLVYHDELPAMGYGLAAQPFGDRVVWLKGGAGPSHSGVIALFPQARAALFIAVNRQEPIFWERMLPRLVAALGDSVPAPAAARAAAASLDGALDGDYRWTRISRGNWEKFLTFGGQIRVRSNADGLDISGPFVGDRPWTPRGPTSFADSAGNMLAFRLDASGRATHAFTVDLGQPFSFERIALHETARVQAGVLLGATVIGLTAGILTLSRNRSASRGGTQPAWARAGMLAVPVAQLATSGAILMIGQQGGLDRLLEGATPALYTMLALTTATAGAALWQTAAGANLATRGQTGVGPRAVYWLGSAAGLGMVWFLGSNNLIGFRF